jgi:gamma-glutamyl phosphate reductase
MLHTLKRNTIKMFREILVYHSKSLEFRAKILTLMVTADNQISPCEHQKLEEIASQIYADDKQRAELLVDTVYEYHNKIIHDNGLGYQHLIQLVAKETKEVKRFCKKIDEATLNKLHQCTIESGNEDEILFQKRVIEFLLELKKECTTTTL